jgi:hypothetical protein
MTPQEIFDTVVTHLFQQGCQSSVEGMCLYRSESGLKCAVGALIPDDAYDPKMDHGNDTNTGIDYLIGSGLLPPDLQKTFERNITLLRDLQDAHDHDLSWGEEKFMKIQLENVAFGHKLDYSVLSKLSFKG